MNSSSNPKSPDPEQPQALKPCPFCHKKPVRAGMLVKHRMSDCALSGLPFDLQRWNNRPTAGSEHASVASLQETLKLRAADKMAWICDDWVNRKIIDARSALADARLSYGDPFKYEWSDLEAPMDYTPALSLPKPSEEREHPIEKDERSLFDASRVCPFCHLWHNPEKSSCDYHDGTKMIRIRPRGPILVGEVASVLKPKQ